MTLFNTKQQFDYNSYMFTCDLGPQTDEFTLSSKPSVPA